MRLGLLSVPIRIETPYTQRARYYSALDGFNIKVSRARRGSPGSRWPR